MNKANRISLLFGLILPLSSPLVFADHPSVTFGASQAGPLITIPAATLPAGQWSAGLRTERVTRAPLSATVLEQSALNGEDVHSVNELTTHYASLAFGISDQLTIGLTLPYISREGIREGALHHGNPEVHDHQDADGLGDATLLGQYQLAKPDKNNIQLAILAGIQFATGDDELTEGGALVEGEFQPGSGTWHPMVGLSASKVFGQHNIDANLLYLHTREGSQQTRIGSLLQYNVAWSHRFSDHATDENHDHGEHLHVKWDAVIELNGERRAKNEVQGLKEMHSGGNLIYLSPGIRVMVADRWSLHVSVGIPVFDATTGTQAEVDYRTNIGIALNF